jgi:hypothetical protein
MQTKYGNQADITLCMCKATPIVGPIGISGAGACRDWTVGRRVEKGLVARAGFSACLVLVVWDEGPGRGRLQVLNLSVGVLCRGR